MFSIYCALHASLHHEGELCGLTELQVGIIGMLDLILTEIFMQIMQKRNVGRHCFSRIQQVPTLQSIL